MTPTACACGCGEPASGRHPRARYASKRCRKREEQRRYYRRPNGHRAVREAARRYRDSAAGRASRAADKARTRGAVIVETFDPREIFDRDNWTCGVCGEPVDREVSPPHPLSASLDHVVPISADGRHERPNVQLAHFRCNASKGHTMDRALREAAATNTNA